MNVQQIKKKTMRKRFKTTRIASSDNYELSRRIYFQHSKRQIKIVSKEQKYIRVFGELIPISEKELRILSTLYEEK